MAHPRKLIRHGVVAQLIAANTAAGTRVEATREEPNRRGELPAIGVYTSSEQVDQDVSLATSPRELNRTPVVHIVAWVGHSKAYPADDRMDDIAEQIEAAMDGDRFISGAVGDSILQSTDMRVKEADGNDPIVGIIVLTYSVTYYTNPFATGDLADYLRTGVTATIEGTQADPVEDAFDQRP